MSYFGATLSWEGKQLKGYSMVPDAGSKALVYGYDYDENGLRTQKSVNNTVTEYYYNGSALMGMTTGTGSSAIVQLFSYDASGKVVAVDYSKGGSNFTTYYYLRNAQGDIVKLIDGSGATVVEYLYDTWGKLLEITGTLKDTLGTNQPFRYRGYFYDNETGWYYLKSRYYNPEVGRFISADVVLSTGQGVLGHNTYAYCLNNPVNMIDETGKSCAAVEDLTQPSTCDGKTLIYAITGIVAASVLSYHLYKKQNSVEITGYSVYGLRDDTGKIVYVGRTKDVKRRQAAHKLNPARAELTMEVLASGLTRIEARGVEQIYMLYYHTINTANKAYNQINGVSPLNALKNIYMNSGRLALEAVGNFVYNEISNEILNWLGG